MSYSLPISPSYRKAIFEAVVLQLILAILSLMILDGGTTARICGIALVAFWGGATVLIWRKPRSPTKTDIEFDSVRLLAPCGTRVLHGALHLEFERC